MHQPTDTVICGTDEVMSKFAHNKFAHTSREFEFLRDYGGDCALKAAPHVPLQTQPIPMVVELPPKTAVGGAEQAPYEAVLPGHAAPSMQRPPLQRSDAPMQHPALQRSDAPMQHPPLQRSDAPMQHPAGPTDERICISEHGRYYNAPTDLVCSYAELRIHSA